MLLAGDIGGTNTRLAAFSKEKGRYKPIKPIVEAAFGNQAFDRFEAIVRRFIDETGLIFHDACIGVAGPVRSGRVSITNLPWVIDEEMLCSQFNLNRVKLLNDLEAIANSVPYLQPGDIETLFQGVARTGNMAVIAPGTGLGEGFLTWNGKEYQAFASEGGHADFAPTNQTEAELREWLADRYDHVSYERVCSGVGIPNIYAFLKESGKFPEPPALKDLISGEKDIAPIIINNAMDSGKAYPICTAVLDLFVSILGSEAGNLALKVSASGGVFIGGGIPLRIAEHLKSDRFISAFRNKGRMSPILQETPVHLIRHPNPALLGAACYGLKLF